MSTYKQLYCSGLTASNGLLGPFARGNATTDTYDIGVFGEYGSTGAKYTGLFRDAAGVSSGAGDWVLFAGLATAPTANQVSGSAVTKANLALAKVKTNSGSAAAPTITFGADTTTGFYYAATELDVAVSGVKTAAIDATGLKLIDGTAAAPSVSFSSDTDSGLYSSGANSVSVATNGAVKFTVGATSASFDAVIATTTFSANTTSTLAANGAVVITGGLGVGENLNVAANVVIGGNLTVSGTTTQIDSTIVNIKDRILNVNASPASVADGGYVVNRYSSDIVADTPKETGTAVAAGSSSTAIQLAAAASASNSYYVNWYVKITASGTGGPPLNEVRQITAYDGTTQVATVAAWSSGVPANDTTYALYCDVYVGPIWDTTAKEIQFLGIPNQAASNIKGTAWDYMSIHCKSVALEQAIQVPYGTAALPGYAFSSDATLGMYGATNTLGFSVGGTSIATITSAGIINQVGSAAAPSYTFTGDTDTGIYHSAANSVAIATNGAIKFTVADTTATMDAAVATTTFSANTASTTTGTGAVVITGGLGVGGQLTTNTLVVTGSMNPAPRLIKTIVFADSPYTVLPSDGALSCNTTGGNIVLNLESIAGLGATKGKVVTVVKSSADANTVTLTPNGTESVMDGVASSTLVLDTQWQSSTIISFVAITGNNTWVAM